MKTELEPQDIEAIAQRVLELLKPYLSSNGKSDDKYINTKKLAEHLGLAYSTIANNKKYLPHFYFNGTPLFKKSEIDNLLERHRVTPKEKKKNQNFHALFNCKR